MTISATLNRVSYVGNGSTTAFPVSFPFHAKADLIVISAVIATGVQIIKALNTHYTISGSVDGLGHYSNGGTVTFLTAPASTELITIYRDPVRTQGLDLQDASIFPAESVEAQIDYLTMLVQRLSDLVNRSIRQPDGDGTSIGAMPAAVTRANKLLAFNGSSEPIVVDPTNASSTAVTATGSTTAILLADLFAREFWVENYGAVGDGITNDYAAIQAAITAAGTAGGGTVKFGSATYAIGTKLLIQSPNVLLQGNGHDMWHEDTAFSLSNAATIIKWIGSSGGTMGEMSSPIGATLQKNTGGGIHGIAFDSGATANGTGAAIGIEFLSWNSAELKHLYFHEFQTVGLRIGCIAGALDDPRDPQHNTFDDILGSQYINVDGGMLWLDGDTTTGGIPSAANVSLNTFLNMGGVFKNGEFLKLSDCDHNYFINCRAFRHPSGTGAAIAFHGSDSGSASQLTARSNTFIGWSGGVKILCYDATYTHPPSLNRFICLDHSNNTNHPETEAAAVAGYPLVMVDSDGWGVSYRQHLFQGMSVYGSTPDGAADQAIDGRALMTTESHRFRNRSANHIVLDRPNVTNEAVEGGWGINVRGATGSAGENLRINRVAGTGCIEVAAAVAGVTTVVTSSPTLTMLTAGISLVSASGGNRIVTLPLAAEFGAGLTARILIRRTDATGNTVTVNPNAAETLNGGGAGTGETIAAGIMRIYVSDGISAWYSNGLNA